jgi:hypothetical protein
MLISRHRPSEQRTIKANVGFTVVFRLCLGGNSRRLRSRGFVPTQCRPARDRRRRFDDVDALRAASNDETMRTDATAMPGTSASTGSTLQVPVLRAGPIRIGGSRGRRPRPKKFAGLTIRAARVQGVDGRPQPDRRHDRDAVRRHRARSTPVRIFVLDTSRCGHGGEKMHGCRPVATRGARQRRSGHLTRTRARTPFRHRDSAAARQPGRPADRRATYRTAKPVSRRDVATIEWLLGMSNQCIKAVVGVICWARGSGAPGIHRT